MFRIKSLALFISLLCSITQAQAQKINVYLKFNEPALSQSIAAFNTYLEEHQIFERYQIEPFLKEHPLHLTLYLATYQDDNIPTIRERVAKIAKHWAPISIKTSNLYVTEGNYVMLDVDNKLINGNNSPLQQLSDLVTLNLNLLRDPDAKIPDWVLAIPEKRKAFEQYGSPNVFFEHSPHFSLMAKLFSDPAQAAAFRQEMTELINQYSFPELKTQSLAIGIGHVNAFGQITEELVAYPLSL